MVWRSALLIGPPQRADLGRAGRGHCDACGHDVFVAFSCKRIAVEPGTIAVEFLSDLLKWKRVSASILLV